MKKLLLAILIALSTTVYCQVVPNGSSRIVLENRLSRSENYKFIIQTLMSSGYFIDQKDIEIGYIKTQNLPVNKWTGTYYLNIVCQENKVIISGMVKSSTSINVSGLIIESGFEPITWKGWNTGLYKIAFENMKVLAEKVEGDLGYE